MRAIKFRAWDKERKEMIQPRDGDFIKWHAPSNWKDCYEIMQYTGMKDTYGKEIYECDILRTHKGDFVVTWNAYQFVLPSYYFASNDVPYDYFSERGKDKVVGNIYENPEGVSA